MEIELIVRILNVIQAGTNWLIQRGMSHDRIQRILDAADGGDVDSSIVQAELNALAAELEATEKLLETEPE